MITQPCSMFANPVWHALQSKHRHLALCAGEACRYPGDVVPFAAVCEPTESALEQLRSLLKSGESVWVLGSGIPEIPGLLFEETLPCLQMVLPDEITPPDSVIEILPLTEADAPEMVALTTLAFPGFFRIRTIEMGLYYGVRSQGELIAMGGERMALDGYTEISGVCTHPAHRGKGYAMNLMWQVVRNHRRDGIVSFLHVGAANHRAIKLYLQMGFQVTNPVTIHRVSRSSRKFDV